MAGIYVRYYSGMRLVAVKIHSVAGQSPGRKGTSALHQVSRRKTAVHVLVTLVVLLTCSLVFSFRTSLETYVHNVRKRQGTEFAAVYPVMLEVLQKGLDSY